MDAASACSRWCPAVRPSQAGFKPQDLITRVGGVPIRQMTELTAILQQMTPGATLAFVVLRGDRQQELSVVFGRRPPEQRTRRRRSHSEAPPLSAAGPPPAAPSLEIPPLEGPAIPGPRRSPTARAGSRGPPAGAVAGPAAPDGGPARRCPRRDRPPLAPHRRVGETRGPVGTGAVGEEEVDEAGC